MDLFEESITVVDNCLKDGKIEKGNVNDVAIGRSSRIPKVQQVLQEFFLGKELCKNINLDETVAFGVAAHAPMLNGVNNKDFVLVDVTLLPLSIKLYTRQMSVLIPRNTPIPTLKEHICSTAYDNHLTVSYPVYKGERHIAKDNNLLGKFLLSGIPSAPKGVPKINVCFQIDAYGIVKCSAVCTIAIHQQQERNYH